MSYHLNFAAVWRNFGRLGWGLALSLELADDWKTPGIEAMIVELETSIQCVHPGVLFIFIKLQNLETYKETVKRYCGPSGRQKTRYNS